MGTAATLAKNTLFSFIATGFELIATLAVSTVLPRNLGIETYGIYSLLMWLHGFATLAANLGVGSMATRFVAESLGRGNKDEPKSLIRLSLVIRCAAALVIALVLLVFSGLWAKIFAHPDDKILFILLAFLFLPNALTNQLPSIFAGFQKYEYSAYLTLSTSPLRAVLVIALAVMGYGIDKILIANIFIGVLTIFIGLFLVRRLVPLKDILWSAPLRSVIKKDAVKYSLIIFGTMCIDYFLWQQAEVLFLSLYRPVEEVGFYRLASHIPSMVMVLIPAVFGTVLLPAIAEQFGRGDMDKLRRMYVTSVRYLMILTFPLAAGGIALSGPLVRLLYGPDYAPVELVMQILFIPYAIKAVSYASTGVIQGINQPSFMFKVGVVLVGIDAGLTLLVIPRYGMLGAALASSLPRILLVIIFTHFASKKVQATWPTADTIKIAAASLVMGLAVFALQSQLSVAVSLALGIPLGAVIFIAALFLLRIVHEQDLAMFRSVQTSLPLPLRKHSVSLIGLVERIMMWSKLSIKQ